MQTKTIDVEKIEGDLQFDGLLKFTCDCEITGSLTATAVQAISKRCAKQ